MRPDAYLINVGRGPLLDQEALIQALQAKEIAGAALDVFEEEPLSVDSPLWDLPGVIVSPHMSGDYRGHERVLAEQFSENLKRWRAGEPLRNVVKKELGYGVVSS